jgi:hypothetical protein
MKTALALFASLILATGTLFAAEEPSQMEAIMVTGSLADDDAAPAEMEQVMVVGSLADDTEADMKLDAIMVVGSLTDEGNDEVVLDEIMVVGSLATAEAPLPRRSHKR